MGKQAAKDTSSSDEPELPNAVLAGIYSMFSLLCILVVIIGLLVGVIVKEQERNNRLQEVNVPFRSQVYIPMNETNRLFTGYEDVDFVCISMEHRKESHFDKLRDTLVGEGIQLTWFQGINGKKLNPNDYNLTRQYRAFFESNQKDFQAGKTTTDYRGHLGCTVSHLNVISNIQNMTVIFEDDAKTVPDFRSKFQAALGAVTRVDPKWEVLLLGWCAKYKDHFYHKLNDHEPIHEGGITKVHYWIGGWAYCIRNKKVAEKILKLFNPLSWHIDLALAEAARSGRLNVYGCMPTLANHQGWLRISTYDFYQIGDATNIKSDTNNEIPDHVE